MANINLYATLADYKAYAVARAQTASTDATDDGVIVDLLERASRYIDDKTRRQFYPSIETHNFDIPEDSTLWLDGDLLSVISLTNGDDVAITSSNYVLLPANRTPYYAIKLKDVSSVDWEADSSNSSMQVLALNAWWGYREQFAQRAWQSVGTLGAAISDTTGLSVTLTAGHSAVTGQIWKVDNEILNGSVSNNTLTAIARGDNGSTAATHLINTAVYKWCPQEQIKGAVLEIANSAYQRRFGKATGESATVTAAGVILTPRDIPAMAEDTIRAFMRLV